MVRQFSSSVHKQNTTINTKLKKQYLLVGKGFPNSHALSSFQIDMRSSMKHDGSSMFCLNAFSSWFPFAIPSCTPDSSTFSCSSVATPYAESKWFTDLSYWPCNCQHCSLISGAIWHVIQHSTGLTLYDLPSKQEFCVFFSTYRVKLWLQWP